MFIPLKQAEIDEIASRPMGQFLETGILFPVVGGRPTLRIGMLAGGLQFNEGSRWLTGPYQRDIRATDAWIVKFGTNG
ncbi:hypothetical protein C8024_03325 [Sphingopyxis sp. BSNA05]|uniref:hypothetical protein n=1 Tax=Sphingopyxis sp. BSNA05 TaxID=1236614 RepID=UPI001C25B90F|nr:hypothetical protein [Sphingopyxis sp. BSNA05]NRD88704.1 hypothetical protein [Sphingopyxis sp. BSNA05]